MSTGQPFLILVSLIYVGLNDLSTTGIIFLLLLLGIVIASRNELFRDQLIYSWEWLTIDGLIIGALTVLYIVIGVYNMPTSPHRNHRFISFFLFPLRKNLGCLVFLAILAVAFIMILFGPPSPR